MLNHPFRKEVFPDIQPKRPRSPFPLILSPVTSENCADLHKHAGLAIFIDMLAEQHVFDLVKCRRKGKLCKIPVCVL